MCEAIDTLVLSARFDTVAVVHGNQQAVAETQRTLAHPYRARDSQTEEPYNPVFFQPDYQPRADAEPACPPILPGAR